MRAIRVEVSGVTSVVEVSGYEDLRREVGGWLELLRFGRNSHSAYIDEEGKLKGLPFNRRATELCAEYGVGLGLGDYIVGPMIILGPIDSVGNDTTCSETLIKEICG